MGDGQPTFRIETSSGKDLLDARALWASIVGPQRLAMSQGAPINLFNNAPAKIHKNLGASKAYVFIGVALPPDSPFATLQVAFGRSDSLGANQSAPYILNGQMGGGPFAPSGFMQLLLPGEDLFAQIVQAGGPAAARVTVAKVMF